MVSRAMYKYTLFGIVSPVDLATLQSAQAFTLLNCCVVPCVDADSSILSGLCGVGNGCVFSNDYAGRDLCNGQAECDICWSNDFTCDIDSLEWICIDSSGDIAL